MKYESDFSTNLDKAWYRLRHLSLTLIEVWRGWLSMSLVWQSQCAAIPSTVPSELDLRAATCTQVTAVTMNQTQSYVSGALGAVLRLSRFVGLAPLRFAKKGNSWLINVSAGLSYIGFFVFLLTNIIIIWNIITDMLYRDLVVADLVPAWNGTHDVVWHIQVVVLTAVVSTLVYSAPKQMRCLIHSLNEVRKINTITDHCPTRFTKKQIGLFILWVATIIACAITDYVAMFTYIGVDINELLSLRIFHLYHVYYWITQLGILQFNLLLLQVRSSFTAINNSLRNLLEVVDTEKKLLHHEVVRQVSIAYAAACGVVRNVDRSYGLSLVVLLSSCFVYLVVTSYYIFTNFVDRNDRDPLYHIIYLLSQCIGCTLHVAALLIIVEPCHLTHMEMKTTRVLVGRLSLHTRSVYDPLAVALEQFLKFIILNDVSYQPMMVTSMTRSLVIQILGSITTYLVIIVELK